MQDYVFRCFVVCQNVWQYVGVVIRCGDWFDIVRVFVQLIVEGGDIGLFDVDIIGDVQVFDILGIYDVFGEYVFFYVVVSNLVFDCVVVCIEDQLVLVGEEEVMDGEWIVCYVDIGQVVINGVWEISQGQVEDVIIVFLDFQVVIIFFVVIVEVQICVYVVWNVKLVVVMVNIDLIGLFVVDGNVVGQFDFVEVIIGWIVEGLFIGIDIEMQCWVQWVGVINVENFVVFEVVVEFGVDVVWFFFFGVDVGQIEIDCCIVYEVFVVEISCIDGLGFQLVFDVVVDIEIGGFEYGQCVG